MARPQTVRWMLRELAGQHNLILWNAPDRYHQGLTAACPDRHREIQLIVSAIDCEIVSEMRRLGRTAIISLLLPKLSRWLTRQSGIHIDEAVWAVNSWAMALGIISFVDETLPEIQPDDSTV